MAPRCTAQTLQSHRRDGRQLGNVDPGEKIQLAALVELLQDRLEAALQLRLGLPDQILLLLPLRPLGVEPFGHLLAQDGEVLLQLANGSTETARWVSSQAGSPTLWLYLFVPVFNLGHGHVSLLLHGGDLVLQRHTLGRLHLPLQRLQLLLELRQFVTPPLLLFQLLLEEVSQLCAALVQLCLQPAGGTSNEDLASRSDEGLN